MEYSAINEWGSRILRTISARLQQTEAALIKNASQLRHCTIIEFLDQLRINIERHGRSTEAQALGHVIVLCNTEKDLGGLGIHHQSWPAVNDATLEELDFLVNAWLLAAKTRKLHYDQQHEDGGAPIKRETDAMTLAQKILAHHAHSVPRASGVRPGDFLRVSVDWIIASELSWQGMSNSIQSLDAPFQPWRNDRFWLSGDHTVDPRNYQEPTPQKLLEGIRKAKYEYKMTENQGANHTIMHTEFCRERAQPGMLVLGSDSHTCSAGCVSSLAIGLGAADVSAALGTGETWIKVPESIRINFVGKPQWYIGGKDVILYVLQQLRRNTFAAERVVEFGGAGSEWLSFDARFGICNMCTELGAITGIFTPDGITKRFVEGRRGRMYRSECTYFAPDEHAEYISTFDIDLGSVEPFIAIYPSPDNVHPITEHLDMLFDGCFIGACTTTEEDLVLAALILQVGLDRGLTLAPGKRIVVPGSRPILHNLEHLGLLEIYSKCGYTVTAPGCSLCLGIGADVAEAGSKWLSSQNRNFKNRMGKGAIGHICSAATVASSSFSMSLTDPRDLLRDVSQPLFQSHLLHCQRARTNRSPAKDMDIHAMSAPAETQPCYSNPKLHFIADHIPRSAPEEQHTGGRLTDTILGRIYRLGDFVDTDAIIPGPACSTCITDDDLAAHCFELVDPLFRDAVRTSDQKIVVAGKAFGCGSSREEAVRALKGLGVTCVIAESFSFIFGRNMATLGLLGIALQDADFFEKAKHQGSIRISISERRIDLDNDSFEFKLDAMEVRLLQEGGLVTSWKKHGTKVFAKLCQERSERSEMEVLRGLEW
ncbi:unnamed protein product [Zymoseptoria tritici ST99CH_1A5]|uniref:Aconitase/3-isopropylmalate dehydratase large subunit alpha/beta/alpha domain-containing protein n=2 Tax=Zymoseptoria tritici TaxID=1047171 RepID=A0A2H1GJ17_ZYMTR|nr:unnamed protein product [Zymoseptoria tritici ST99CH_1E4]SMY25085.1 unnamed protein product [Zymoseptoria tritici ST99CH_1A5]